MISRYTIDSLYRNIYIWSNFNRKYIYHVISKWNIQHFNFSNPGKDTTSVRDSTSRDGFTIISSTSTTEMIPTFSNLLENKTDPFSKPLSVTATKGSIHRNLWFQFVITYFLIIRNISISVLSFWYSSYNISLMLFIFQENKRKELMEILPLYQVMKTSQDVW